MMKTFVLVVLAIASFVNVEARVINDEAANIYTAYDYLVKYGIPEAERIRKIEENNAARIVGGIAAGPAQYPYQAGLLSSIVGINDGRRGICGGSLVSTSRVITAAHCWFDGRNQAWQFEVVLGSNALFFGGERLFTSAVVMHPNWNSFLIRNDVAVIYLPKNVAVSNIIRPVALPSGAQLNEDFAGERGIASGFGLTSDSQNSIPADQVLHHVSLNILSNEQCSRILVVIQDSNICTRGIGGVGTCSGDSGGPLVVQRNGQPVLVGIVSFGTVFGSEVHLPAAYGRVTSFMSFFNQHL